MKRLILPLTILGIVIMGCQKSSNEVTKNSNPALNNNTTKPVASFRIVNTYEHSLSTVVEGQTLVFDNKSVNGSTYLWDFGNGVTSTETNPQNISLAPCTAPRTITLTVTNSKGEKATASSTYNITCYRIAFPGGLPPDVHPTVH